MPRMLTETKRFKMDKKRIKGSGRYDWDKMRKVVIELMNDRPIDPRHCDHKLSGEYFGVRECHTCVDIFCIQVTKIGILTNRHDRSGCTKSR